jgi:NTP pyrophosphatase (non-canonical NTP hydrolase)
MREDHSPTVTMDELVQNVLDWAEQKDLLHQEYHPKQMMKIMEELGELSQACLKDNPMAIIDGIGDVFVTVIILAKQLGYSPKGCLFEAWNEIKNRTGKMHNGTFIKDQQ